MFVNCRSWHEDYRPRRNSDRRQHNWPHLTMVKWCAVVCISSTLFWWLCNRLFFLSFEVTPRETVSERERDVYLQKTQASRRTVVHQSCSLCSNNQIMIYILEVTNSTFNLGKIRRKKEEKRVIISDLNIFGNQITRRILSILFNI